MPCPLLLNDARTSPSMKRHPFCWQSRKYKSDVSRSTHRCFASVATTAAATHRWAYSAAGE
eukprot:365542-Chlamydomonas_euryale.AAC.45